MINDVKKGIVKDCAEESNYNLLFLFTENWLHTGAQRFQLYSKLNILDVHLSWEVYDVSHFDIISKYQTFFIWWWDSKYSRHKVF